MKRNFQKQQSSPDFSKDKREAKKKTIRRKRERNIKKLFIKELCEQ